jgi:O-antigen/teichoic acid export membrane protein
MSKIRNTAAKPGGTTRLLVHRLAPDRSLNWALLDQATASGVNFLTTILLARQLGIEQFGTFMLAWLVLLLFKSLQGGLIISPMMSIGPKQAAGAQAGYYGSVLLQQVAQALIGTGLFLGGYHLLVAVRPQWQVPELVVPVAAAIVADQLQEFARRYLFTRDRACHAFMVDLVTYGSRTILLLLFLRGEGASGEVAFSIVFISSVAGVAVSVPGFVGVAFDWTSLVQTAQRHWRFAKWTAASAMLEWGAGHFIVIIAGGVLGPAVVGAIRATTNVFAPIQVLTLALNNAVPVRASHRLLEGGEAALKDYLLQVTLYGLVACGVILAAGGIFAEPILHVLYGPGFAEYAYLMRWWIIIYAVSFLQFPLSVALRTVEFTRPFFVSVACEAAFGLLAAYILPQLFGIHGVMFGILVTRALPVLILGWYAFGWWRRPAQTAPAPPFGARRERA